MAFTEQLSLLPVVGQMNWILPTRRPLPGGGTSEEPTLGIDEELAAPLDVDSEAAAFH